MKKSHSLFLRISIAVALLIFLFFKTDRHALSQTFGRAHPGLMLGAFGLLFLLNILVCWRWDILLRGLDIRVPFGRLLASYFASLFFNLVSPSTIGGDTVRTLDISHYAGRHSSGILATVILDRVTGFFGLFTVLIFSLFFGFRYFGDGRILLVTFLLLVGVAFFSLAMFNTRFFHALVGCLPFKVLKDYLIKTHEATVSFSKRRGFLLAAWGLSVATHIGIAFVFYLSALALDIRLSAIYFLIFAPLVTVFSTLPISIAGLGLRENACVVVFAMVGLAKEPAGALGFSNSLFVLAVGLVGGIAYVAALHRRRV